MNDYNITGATARWAVIWLVKKPGQRPHLIEHEFGNDLTEALRIRDLAIKAGKKFVTLRSMNVGFPPPEKYRPHEEVVFSGRYKIVKRKGKRYRKKIMVEQYVIPLDNLNATGVWWCPYCMKLRRFKRADGFWHEGEWVEESGYHCPICRISHRDFHVRKWNPAANRYYSSPPRRMRRSNGRKRKRS